MGVSDPTVATIAPTVIMNSPSFYRFISFYFYIVQCNQKEQAISDPLNWEVFCNKLVWFLLFFYF